MDVIVCIAFAGGLGIGMLIQFLYGQRNKNTIVVTPSASHNIKRKPCSTSNCLEFNKGQCGYKYYPCKNVARLPF